ncbi:hypothetical protein ES704_00843 [subsurface metagenome]|jgi:hypothetical protein
MEFSEFALRVILLFLPGIVSLLIIDNLTNHKEYKLYEKAIYSLIYSFFCYYLFYLLLIIYGFWFKVKIHFSFFDALINKESVLDFNEIGYTTIISIFVGFIFSAFINYKVVNKIARKFKITKKYAEVNVWSYLMNSEKMEWVVIRDIKNDLMYEGWIEAFSDSTEKDEIFLRDVKVFKNSTSEELYDILGLYLPSKRVNLIVEFPTLEFTELINRSEKKE